MSREEKKSQLMRLYNEDVRTADSMLCSGNKALEALREELDAVRCAAGVPKTARRNATDSLACRAALPPKHGSDEVERLRQAVESAAAVLRAILPTDDDDSDPLGSAGVAEATPLKLRAKSEGACRELAAVTLRPALCRTPRSSSRPKRKVSFGSQPEEEPPRRASLGMDSDGDDAIVALMSPPPQKYRAEPDSPSPATFKKRPVVAQSSNGSTSTRLHLTWFATSLGLVGLCGLVAFHMGSQYGGDLKKPSAIKGDSACWSQGFSADFCCNKALGNEGNIGCWDGQFTFERCCHGKKEL